MRLLGTDAEFDLKRMVTSLALQRVRTPLDIFEPFVPHVTDIAELV
jgi:hypothetical protein